MSQYTQVAEQAVPEWDNQQAATTQGLQNVLAGTQRMTVYEAVEKEAEALAETAIALAKGEEPETTGTVEDADAGREVNSILLDPEAITKDNVQTVVDDGFATVDEVCTPKFADACAAAGIS